VSVEWCGEVVGVRGERGSLYRGKARRVSAMNELGMTTRAQGGGEALILVLWEGGRLSLEIVNVERR
jgi:hypothetical protein